MSLLAQRALLADEDGDRPIHVAAVHGDEELVRRLCGLMKSVGASLDSANYLGQTPLHLAVLAKKVGPASVLLQEGASLPPRDRGGNTALHLAVRNFDRPCLRLLLDHPDRRRILDARNYDGYTPLHEAVFRDNLSAVRMLVAAGCDVDAGDGKSGRTALMHSVMKENDDAVCLLKKFGACPRKTDYSGIDPVRVASDRGNVALAAILEGKVTANAFSLDSVSHFR
ncbi:B-cell lymphoma 3 protein-like [Centruroides vittatus]|uniref:B-cell lymphoma 3 protein-like n=1 Tax=Centruroides vittatus TaxID=120091 RepID=UPI00350EE474